MFESIQKLLYKIKVWLGIILLITLLFIPEFREGLIYIFYLWILLLIYALLRFYLIPKFIKKFNTVKIEFDKKTYIVSRKKANLIHKAFNNDIKSQYEIINEFYETEKSNFIPTICFYFTKLIAEKDSDIGVIVQLGNMYEEGIGIRKNKNKALECYNHALSLYDNPSPNLYIPEDTNYRQYLVKLIISLNS